MFTGNNNYFTKILEELKKNLKYWCSHGNPGDPLTTPLCILQLSGHDTCTVNIFSSDKVTIVCRY